jgi:hypothetical protein
VVAVRAALERISRYVFWRRDGLRARPESRALSGRADDLVAIAGEEDETN